MIDAISYWASMSSGLVLLAMCALGIRGFLPRALMRGDPAARTLAIAIVASFMAGGFNALYWQVWGQVAQALGLVDLHHVRLVGGYLDVAFKLGAAAAIWLHLRARRLSLPEGERRKWTDLGMAFYPRRTGSLSRFLNAMREDRP